VYSGIFLSSSVAQRNNNRETTNDILLIGQYVFNRFFLSQISGNNQQAM